MILRYIRQKSIMKMYTMAALTAVISSSEAAFSRKSFILKFNVANPQLFVVVEVIKHLPPLVEMTVVIFIKRHIS